MKRTLVQSLLLVALGVSAGGVAHLAQRSADAHRFGGPDRSVHRVMPDASTARVASLGQPTLVADALWIRATLTFSDLMDGPDEAGIQWLRAMLRTVGALEPGWRTLYFYGGSMMRVMGDIDGSDEIFAMGGEHLPDDPYFPFSLGMNAYLYRQDPIVAARYLDKAAALPGAPAWYGAAAAGFLDERGQRRAALEYLRQQIEVEEDEEARKALERKFNSVLHDELGARIDERRREVAAQQGIDPDEGPLPPLSALGPLPDEPTGSRWIVGPDGHVRSEQAELKLARKLRDQERHLLTAGF